jgi:hypothetical protein
MSGVDEVRGHYCVDRNAAAFGSAGSATASVSESSSTERELHRSAVVRADPWRTSHRQGEDMQPTIASKPLILHCEQVT